MDGSTQLDAMARAWRLARGRFATPAGSDSRRARREGPQLDDFGRNGMMREARFWIGMLWSQTFPGPDM